MKTAKALSTITLVATIILVPMSSAWAHHGGHHGHHSGAAWGAAVGGTMLGFALSNIANQPRQASKPQVVVVQPQAPPTSDVNFYQQQRYLDLELDRERERARNLALEREIARIRAAQETE